MLSYGDCFVLNETWNSKAPHGAQRSLGELTASVRKVVTHYGDVSVNHRLRDGLYKNHSGVQGLETLLFYVQIPGTVG